MDAERDKREARKKMYFELYFLVILRISMYGELDKKSNLARHYFQIGVIFCAKTNTSK